mmetsp:Transcript_167/g.177  ORF Transcript_167/g.177 Transcript_167/m.177 type:complete len:421 (-) Transcript_167:135-1397(-)
MGYYKGKYQHDGLTTTLKHKGRMTLFRFGGLVVLFGGCLNLIQTARRLRKPRPPVYSSLRNLKSVDYSTMRKLVTVIENEPEGENCRWVEPEMVNQTEDLFSTILVAYPGSGKRAAFLQLEGLTQLLTQDDWSLNDRPKDAKYAFIKTQYPHHEGVWAWGGKGNQTIYVLQNPRTALQTYMFLLHEINYADGWMSSRLHRFDTFKVRPSVDEWIDFKRDRFTREVNSWSWHLEYWMENGLLRDVFTHNLTNPEIMDGIMNPSIYTEAELSTFQDALSDVNATFDRHCVEGDMPYCLPVAIVSYEKLMQESTGPAEVGKLARVIQNQPSMNVVDESVWKCVWKKVIIEKDTGVRIDSDREGPDMETYRFTVGEVETIIDELERLKEKYSTSQLSMTAPLYEELVSYLTEYIADQYSYLHSL